jgi:hypothetical protein
MKVLLNYNLLISYPYFEVIVRNPCIAGGGNDVGLKCLRGLPPGFEGDGFHQLDLKVLTCLKGSKGLKGLPPGFDGNRLQTRQERQQHTDLFSSPLGRWVTGGSGNPILRYCGLAGSRPARLPRRVYRLSRCRAVLRAADP